jgi:hypothetical protein
MTMAINSNSQDGIGGDVGQTPKSGLSLPISIPQAAASSKDKDVEVGLIANGRAVGWDVDGDITECCG